MARVELEHVDKTFPDGTRAVADVSLRVEDGELFVLVGPSGCGKSTVLRLVAGLETATAGVISIADRVVNDVPPQERNVAMVFQDYALYPHMTARKNLAFPLRMRRLGRAEVASRVARVAALLEIEALLDRLPRQLSGGQRQRVAMGRALVREPAASLLDEPLSNLDPRAARPGAGRHPGAAGTHRHDDALRHARSGRGHDPRASRRRDGPGTGAAGGDAARAVRRAGQRDGGGVRRQSADEPAAGAVRAGAGAHAGRSQRATAERAGRRR